ncbi:Uncharacterized protein APZ42_013078 [Daphnia magna]|uniref:Uncharacterized protein n=1 Tax=Daphnia magna TaxID=35525 RepID=A0A162R6G1_9CRUS|nr:Uncharacterized protein APZ42_013078 [Daphnia magna]
MDGDNIRILKVWSSNLPKSQIAAHTTHMLIVLFSLQWPLHEPKKCSLDFSSFVGVPWAHSHSLAVGHSSQSFGYIWTVVYLVTYVCVSSGVG